MNAVPDLSAPSRPMSSGRAWLVLSRGSNLPTVWSNCLAGWWLAGGWISGSTSTLRALLLLTGASLLYTAGMWLNDAYDSEWDAHYRPERPIPAGMPRRLVARAGAWLIMVGCLCLFPLGWTTLGWTLALTVCIEAYNRVHKQWAHAPWLMAGCRFCLYPLGASVGTGGVGRFPLIGGFAMALYIAGITYLARSESVPTQRPSPWPWGLLAAPLAAWVFLLVNPFESPASNWLLILPFACWLWRAWRIVARGGLPIGDLLAGIVLVDLLLIPSPTIPRSAVFVGLFLGARIFQRVIPAT